MTQPDLFQGDPLESPRSERIASLLQRVHAFMSDGQFHGLREIAGYAKCSECSASARLRELRRRFGRTIERKSVSQNLYHYRMNP